MQTSVTSSEQAQVYKFSPWVAVGIPFLAVFLQAYLPLHLRFVSVVDLPLLVTIFFAVARRGQISGLVTGGAIGLLQDSLTHRPLGLYGISKTVIGYLASSIGMKLDVENPGSRFLMTFFFYLLHHAIYFIVARGLASQVMEPRWGHTLLAALINSLVAVPLFILLDKLKQRT